MTMNGNSSRSRGQSSKANNHNIIAALDIGTTKTAVVVARVNPAADKSVTGKTLEVIGVASHPSTGMRKGAVVNIDATVESIRRAKEDAELMAGYTIDSAWAGVAGDHIRSFNSRGMVAIKNHEVAADDIGRVIEAAQAVALPEDRQVLHVLPQAYSIDSQDGIRDPLGMAGVRLEAGVHMITAQKTALMNIQKCADRAGIKLRGMVLEPLASAEATLSADEKDLGVAVVDMGGGTCDMIIYVGGVAVYTAVLPIGGAHLTHDISVGLRTPANEAEEIKKKYGCAMASLVQAGEIVEVLSVGGRNPRTLPRTTLAEVIEPRIEETLHLLNNEIVKSGYKEFLGSGVVLTGGASSLEGLVELGEFIFEMPVRRGLPNNTSGLVGVVQRPEFTTAVGLLKFGAESKAKSVAAKSDSMIERIKYRLSDFLDGAF